MESRATVLIVDDQPTERRLLHHALKKDYRILEAGDAAEALGHLGRQPPDLVLLDLHLPPRTDGPEEGIRLQRTLREREPHVPIVVVTGDEDRSLALEMVNRGVADFLLKPIDPGVLEIVVARALEKASLEREVRELRREVRHRYSFGNLIGESALMREVFAKLEKLAQVSTTVLLLGESGTGKSAIARALHYASARASEPFVVVDGAAIPESLLESELFGHVEGAFTGAASAKRGRIERADGGTLFLDEIGNLSPSAQAKLLLFLDSRSFSRVGSNERIEVDVRLVVATNQDLDRMVREDRFREDLLYRIQVATVILPPLRERKEDIVPLCHHLLAARCREMGREPARLASDAAGLLEDHPWPGNVRQLEHVLETSLVLADGNTLRAADLALPPLPSREARGDGSPAGPDDPPGDDAGFKERVARYERELLRDALSRTGGNKVAAGRDLGLDENQIRYLCRKYGIS